MLKKLSSRHLNLDLPGSSFSGKTLKVKGIGRDIVNKENTNTINDLSAFRHKNIDTRGPDIFNSNLLDCTGIDDTHLYFDSKGVDTAEATNEIGNTH